jgi:hypothetical protein
MGFLQQALEPVLQPDAIADHLMAATHHRSPQPLLRIRHEAQRQLLRHQPLHQTFGIGKIPLAPPSSAIRLRLRQVQRPSPPSATTLRLPVPLQHFPHGPPILCCRLHHYFVDLRRVQPLRKRPQLYRPRPKATSLEPRRSGPRHARDHHGQHPFVNVDACDPTRHHLLLTVGAERVQGKRLLRVSGSCRDHGVGISYLFARWCTRRISQFSGLEGPTGSSTSPPQPRRVSQVLSCCS